MYTNSGFKSRFYERQRIMEKLHEQLEQQEQDMNQINLKIISPIISCMRRLSLLRCVEHKTTPSTLLPSNEHSHCAVIFSRLNEVVHLFYLKISVRIF